jgi:hypothetical protein
MSSAPAPGPGSRSAAVADLFAALEGLLISYQALPDAEREGRWDAEAELITGAVALHLSTARSRIAAGSRPPGARPVPQAAAVDAPDGGRPDPAATRGANPPVPPWEPPS